MRPSTIPPPFDHANLRDEYIVQRRVEEAIDKHPRIERYTIAPRDGQPIAARAFVDAGTAEILVRRRGATGAPVTIRGIGNTASAAAEDLVSSLDSWAIAIGA